MTASTVQNRSCEACGGRLCGRGPAKTGLCFRCRQDAAAFAAAWAVDLRERGASDEHIAHVVGYSSADAVRARIADRKRAAGTRSEDAAA